MLSAVKSNEDYSLTDEALDALIEEEWLDAMGDLQKDYLNIPVPTQAKDAVQTGIERAKQEAQQQAVLPVKPKRSGRFWSGVAVLSTAAAVMLLFVTLNTNQQLAVAAAEFTVLKPVVELITGQEYHKDVYLDIKVAHLAGAVGNDASNNMPLSALFVDQADYVTRISDEIKHQMVQSDEYAVIGETFTAIAPDQHYYINADGKLVIVLDGYDIALEFIIDTDVIASILK